MVDSHETVIRATSLPSLAAQELGTRNSNTSPPGLLVVIRRPVPAPPACSVASFVQTRRRRECGRWRPAGGQGLPQWVAYRLISTVEVYVSSVLVDQIQWTLPFFDGICPTYQLHRQLGPSTCTCQRLMGTTRRAQAWARIVCIL